MEEEHALVQFEPAYNLSLSSHLGHHDDGCEDDELELVDEIAHFQLDEGEATARHSLSTRTRSREVPPEQSPSGRLYQSQLLSLAEFSGPTTSIRSRTSRFVSSVRPLPLPRAPSLTNWMPTASLLRYNQRCESSQSPRTGQLHLAPLKSTGKNGTTSPKTNSSSIIKGTGRQPQQDTSRSLIGYPCTTPNR
ncbi:P4 [Barleria polerovirus 1]|uniref:P4 n=1 Tax=Barleria polerovirus 1 TaxID=2838079 RepID=A0A8E7UEI4_9VIRU|nr:P4 [Barleria polerovirus 1]